MDLTNLRAVLNDQKAGSRSELTSHQLAFRLPSTRHSYLTDGLGIVNLDGHAGLNLVFEAQVGLLHVGFVIIGLENEDGRSACSAADRRCTAGRCDRRTALGGWI